jgi:hypothetical protein
LDGSETITSYLRPRVAKKVFASSMWMRLRGSEYARSLRGAKWARPLDHHPLDLDRVDLGHARAREQRSGS